MDNESSERSEREERIREYERILSYLVQRFGPLTIVNAILKGKGGDIRYPDLQGVLAKFPPPSK